MTPIGFIILAMVVYFCFLFVVGVLYYFGGQVQSVSATQDSASAPVIRYSVLAQIGNLFKANPDDRTIAIIKRLYHNNPRVTSCKELGSVLTELKHLLHVQINKSESKSALKDDATMMKRLREEVDPNITERSPGPFFNRLMRSVGETNECIVRAPKHDNTVIDFKPQLDDMMKDILKILRDDKDLTCADVESAKNRSSVHFADLESHEQSQARTLLENRVVEEETTMQEFLHSADALERKLCR